MLKKTHHLGFGMTRREAWGPRHLVTMGGAIVAFALLLVGSYATILLFFGQIYSPERLSRSDYITYGAFLYWPITLTVFWLTTAPVLWAIGRPRLIAMTTVGTVVSIACTFIVALLFHFPPEGIESVGLPGVVVRAVVIVEMLAVGSGWAIIIWGALVQPLRHVQRDTRF